MCKCIDEEKFEKANWDLEMFRMTWREF